MRILLSTIKAKNLYTSLALLYLKVSILNNGLLKDKVKVRIKEFNIFDKDDFIIYEIQKSNPQIIGFSTYVWNMEKILSLTRNIKKINPNIKIVLGGPQVSPIASDVLQENVQIDFIVRGEGEVTFTELIKSLLNSGNNIDKVLGIAYRNNGRIIENAHRQIISDMDSIPSPYLRNSVSLKDREVCLETQRGCLFKCHFCYYNKGFDRVRFFSLKRVKKDLSFLLKRKLKRIYLMDPVFNVNTKRAKEICKFIIKNNKHNIQFHTEIRAELMDRELVDIFFKANVRYLEIGLQSSEGKVLHSVNRRLNTKRFIDGINLLKKYDFESEIQLILGLPKDTRYSFMKSLEFALSFEPKKLSIFRLQVLPGTEIWHKASEWGVVYEDRPPYYFLQSKTLSFNDAIQLIKIEKSLNLFRAKNTIRLLCKETRTGLLDIIKSWLDWLNDDEFVLNSRNSDFIAEKFRKFIKYFCKKNKINFNFYDSLLHKEVIFSMESEKEQMDTAEST